MSVDPLAGQFPAHSPYAYTFNDPVNLVDPTGMAPALPECCGNGSMIGFDALQTWQNLGRQTLRRGPSTEGKTTRAAEFYGFEIDQAMRLTD